MRGCIVEGVDEGLPIAYGVLEKGIPVLALADSIGQIQTPDFQSAGFQDCQSKFDKDAMLESLSRLASAIASAETSLVCAGEVR